MKTSWRILTKLAGRVRALQCACGPRRRGELMRHAASFVLACLFLLIPHALRAAATLDPRLEYRTVETARFRVHYPAPAAYNLAVRVARLAERALARDVALLCYAPQGVIDIVLSDAADEANGSAEVLPKNTLRLFLSAPSEPVALYAYDDWLEMLLIHELAHIVDIDQTHNVSRVLRYVFGKTVQYNGAVPQFLSEGVAVFAETQLTEGGRGRSAYVEGVLRMAALEGAFVRLDQAHLFLPGYPAGNAAYFYGGRFHLYLAAHYGDEAVGILHRLISEQPIPYLFELASRRLFQKNLEELWQDFEAEERGLATEVAAAVRARAMTVSSRRLVAPSVDVRAVRYLSEHVLALSQRGSKDGASLRILALTPDGGAAGTRVLRRDIMSTQIAPFPTGDTLVAAQASLTHRFDTHSDLLKISVKTGRSVRLFDAACPKKSLRGRDPAVSPDGLRVAFVRNRLYQSYLVVGTFVGSAGALRLETQLSPSGDRQLFTPAWSPDGRALAVSMTTAGGAREVVLFDLESGRITRRLTSDGGQNTNPVFSRDGSLVAWQSDASGIYNIVAERLSTGERYQLTDEIGGAMSPDFSPDGRKMVYRALSGKGISVEEQVLPQNVGRLLASGHLAEEQAAAARLMEQARALPARELEPRLALREGETETPYRPLKSLLPFHDNWQLTAEIFSFNGDAGFWLRTGGQDSLGYHSYSLRLGTSLRAHAPNVGLQYSWERYWPSVTWTGELRAVPFLTKEGWVVEHDRTLGVGVTWPWAVRHRAEVTYTLQFRHGDARAERLLPLGRIASLDAGYRYQFVHSYPFSAGLERGRSAAVGITYYGPALGGAKEELLLRGDARLYVNVPRSDNVVLALRLHAAVSLAGRTATSFFLYGTQEPSPLTTQSQRLLPLRGFMPHTRASAPPEGRGVVAAYLELRAPLLQVRRGLWLLPIAVQRLHGALFVDAGYTYGHADAESPAPEVKLTDALMRPSVSTGAEVRCDFLLGWQMGLTARLGLAQPLLQSGRMRARSLPPLIYFGLGGAI